MNSKSCFLHLVRHGATANNLMRPPRLQGRREDLSLSTEGRDQAERTAAVLAERSLAAVVASPLRRATETAHIIAQPHGVDVKIVEALTEVDVGAWEGMQWDEIERTDPHTYRNFMTDPGVHGYPQGENTTQVLDRVAPAFERLMREYLGSEIAVVAHNVVIRTYLGHLLGVSSAKSRGVPQDNGGLNLIRYRDGRIRPLSINSVLHLRKL